MTTPKATAAKSAKSAKAAKPVTPVAERIAAAVAKSKAPLQRQLARAAKIQADIAALIADASLDAAKFKKRVTALNGQLGTCTKGCAAPAAN